MHVSPDFDPCVDWQFLLSMTLAKPTKLWKKQMHGDYVRVWVLFLISPVLLFLSRVQNFPIKFSLIPFRMLKVNWVHGFVYKLMQYILRSSLLFGLLHKQIYENNIGSNLPMCIYNLAHVLCICFLPTNILVDEFTVSMVKVQVMKFRISILSPTCLPWQKDLTLLPFL